MIDRPVRAARLDDRDAVAAFTSDTFDWGDYVADSWPDLLEEEHSHTLVATDDDDRPISVVRAVLMSSDEAWLHAARTHPEFRRQGLAGHLNSTLMEWCAAQGTRVARLLVEDWNEPAQRQVVSKLGYRAVARTTTASRALGQASPNPLGNGGQRVRSEERRKQAPRSEAEPAMLAWSAGELARVSHGLSACDGWRWKRLTLDGLETGASSGGFWECRSGWLLTEESPDELAVMWLATEAEDATSLVRAIVDRASDDGHEHVRVMAPNVPWLAQALRTAGFDLQPSTIYEKQLAPHDP